MIKKILLNYVQYKDFSKTSKNSLKTISRLRWYIYNKKLINPEQVIDLQGSIDIFSLNAFTRQ